MHVGYDIHWDTGFTLTPGGQYSLVNNVQGGTLFTGGHYSLRHQDLEAQPHSNPRVEECMVIEDDDAKSHHRNESQKV